MHLWREVLRPGSLLHVGRGSIVEGRDCWSDQLGLQAQSMCQLEGQHTVREVLRASSLFWVVSEPPIDAGLDARTWPRANCQEVQLKGA